MKEERIQNSMSMGAKHMKAYSSESKLPDQLSRSLAVELEVVQRSYSCSSKAFTFSTGKIRDVSLHGVRKMNKVEQIVFVPHLDSVLFTGYCIFPAEVNPESKFSSGSG